MLLKSFFKLFELKSILHARDNGSAKTLLWADKVGKFKFKITKQLKFFEKIQVND